jgi:hypothetical protein
LRCPTCTLASPAKLLLFDSIQCGRLQGRLLLLLLLDGVY